MSIFRLVIDRLGLSLDAPERQFLAGLAVADTVEYTENDDLFQTVYARSRDAGFNLDSQLMRTLDTLASQEAQNVT